MTYSIAEAERLTGIKAHTLRIWEKRYDFLVPERTDTNIRFFSDDQLRKLINVSILIQNKHRISTIARMDDDEINQTVSGILTSDDTSHDEIIKALVMSMLKLDEAEFNNIFNRQILKQGLVNTILHIIYPFLEQVGVLWGTNKVLPAQEHFTSNLIRQKLISAFESLPQPAPDAPKIVLFLLEDENHEIALLLGAFIAKDLGWKVYYLGQNVPSEDIATLVDYLNPRLLMTMFIIPRPKKRDDSFCEMLVEKNMTLLYGGNPKSFPCTMASENFVAIKNPNHFIDFLNHSLATMKEV
ncbi:MerR family transcriptional regulator [Namhaeicola litoreus]|uniref:MerR family transcriptional regulator n=1 Tax=Namhaeicola litoreus TaxID=1052145 RepID=A0ABW3Y0L2_9FLAO